MKRNLGITAFVFIVGLVISFSYLNYAFKIEQEKVDLEIIATGDRNYLALQALLENQLILLQALGSFFQGSENVTRQEFAVFTDPLLKSRPEVQALGWVPVVSDKDREKFEADQNKEFPGFFISERATQGKMIVRKQASDYFPVTYIAPIKGNEQAVGFDLSSHPVRKDTIFQSIRTGEMAATGRITLVQETEGDFALLVFYPVKTNLGADGPTPADKQKIRGFVTGVFRIGDIIRKAKMSLPQQDVSFNLAVYDRSGMSNQQVLYSELRDNSNTKNLFYQQFFPFVDRQWELIAIPNSDFMKRHQRFGLWVIFGLGILITILLSTFIYMQLKTAQSIAQRVKLRTHELQTSEMKTQKILDTILNGLITMDSKGTVILFNPAAEKIFQYQAEEVVGQNIKMLMPEPYHEHHDQYLKNYLETGIRKVIGIGREVLGKRKDGSVFPLRLTVGEMQVDGVNQYVGIVRDITEQKQARLELIAAKEAAEEANRLKSEFLNTMSHELRTPLTVIMGNISDLTDLDDLPDPEEIVEITKDIEDSGDHLMVLINDMLDLSKIEAGKMILHRENTKTEEIIHSVINSLTVLAEKKGLNLVGQTDDSHIWADSIRVKQILLNIIGNAIKFTAEGEIKISTESDGQMVTFHIADTGCGIDEAGQKIIFDPFRQVDGSSKRTAGGTGLGLAITKKLVELHGGTIWLNSIIDQGSTFSFTLPISQEQQ